MGFRIWDWGFGIERCSGVFLLCCSPIGAGSTKLTRTASLLRASLGWGGKPPRPVTTKALLSPSSHGFWAIRVLGSTTLVGKVANPRVGSTPGVLMTTVPLKEESAPVAVMSLSGGTFWSKGSTKDTLSDDAYIYSVCIDINLSAFAIPRSIVTSVQLYRFYFEVL